MKLPRTITLEKSLGVAGCSGVPLEQWLLRAREVVVQTGVKLLPSMVDGRLVEEAVYDVGMVPVRLVAAVLEVMGNVIKVAVPAGEKGSTEPTGPGSLAMRVFDNAVGVRARGASVGVLVVLVERVGAPEDAIAARARVPLVPLVELVLVPFPVELALEGDVAKGTPKGSRGLGRAPIAGLCWWCRCWRCWRL